VRLYVVLAWLARSAVDPFDRTLLLALGNLGLATLLTLPKIRGGPLLQGRTTTAALIGWSVTYSIIYGAFVRWPEFIPVWALVAAQACAPLAAIFISGDHRRDSGPLSRRIVLTSPIVFLLSIAFLEWRLSSYVPVAPLIAAALVVLFALSQACARVVARSVPNALWGPPRLALLNGLLLLAFWVVAGPAKVHVDGLTLVRSAAVLSIGILALQALYLFGLANTPPFLAGLLLSTCVPISIFGDEILKARPTYHPLLLWLSVGFSAAMGFVTWVTTRKAGNGLITAVPVELEID